MALAQQPRMRALVTLRRLRWPWRLALPRLIACCAVLPRLAPPILATLPPVVGTLLLSRVLALPFLWRLAECAAVLLALVVALRRPSGTEVRRMASKERRSAKGEGGGGDCATWRERVSTARWQLLMAQGAAREARWNGRGQLWPWEHTQAKR